MDYESGCLVCGAELTYLDTDSLMTCYYCGTQHNANAQCVNGHYICDECHRGSANDFIE